MTIPPDARILYRHGVLIEPDICRNHGDLVWSNAAQGSSASHLVRGERMNSPILCSQAAGMPSRKFERIGKGKIFECLLLSAGWIFCVEGE